MKNELSKRFFPASGNDAVLHIKDVTVYWYDNETVVSTMDTALSLHGEGAPPWTLVTAAKQEKGRGTQGRDWFSMDGGGLYCSLILPAPDSLEALDGLTAATADILVQTLVRFTGPLDYAVKRPNDVLIGGKKVAGILYETQSDGDAVTSLIFGLGLNFTQTAEDFASIGLNDATSLLIENGKAPETIDFLRFFLSDYIPMYKGLTGFRENIERI